MSIVPERKCAESSSGRKHSRGVAAPKLKRHYHVLSPRETDELVTSVADIVVSFLAKEGEAPALKEGELPSDSRANESNEPLNEPG